MAMIRRVATNSGLGPAPRSSGVVALCAAGAGAVLATVVARGMLDGRAVYPGCGFRWLTDHPCPACGGTHALAALGSGEIAASLGHNPLVALVALACVVLALGAALDHWLNRGRWAARLEPRGRAVLRRARWWLPAAVVINWAYLLGFAP